MIILIQDIKENLFLNNRIISLSHHRLSSELHLINPDDKTESVSLTIKDRICSYVPIQKQLQEFFNLPNVLQNILDYQKDLEMNHLEFYKNML